MIDKKIEIVIMAGGQGSRFWPLSRNNRPKQFLSVSLTGESLIQGTARRANRLGGVVSVVTHKNYERLVNEHLPNIQVISEPIAKNTAASIALSTAHALYNDPETIMVVLPADHTIRAEDKWVDIINKGIKVANEQDLLLTVGIVPTTPNTAYGYIQRGAQISEGAYAVKRFFEKPNLSRASQYTESGDFYWNSGMFIWKAKVIKDAFISIMPSLWEETDKILQSIGTKDYTNVVEAAFEKAESISIDFGIMEHAHNVGVIEAGDFGWNDVGSWDSWASEFVADTEGNVSQGDTILIDTNNSVVKSNERFVALVGCDNMVVIDAPDALLVCSRDKVQDVRKIVEELKKRGRKELL